MNFKITGKTFDHRETLKSLGCTWDNNQKCWFFEDRNLIEKVRGLVGVVIVEVPQVPSSFKNEDYESRYAPATKTKFFGNDPTYFNSFVFENPRAFFGFSDLSTLINYVENIPSEIKDETESRRNIAWSTTENRGEWTGTETMDDAIDLAKNGWTKGVEMAEEIREKLNAKHAVQRKRKYSLAGGSVNVGRLLSGNPLNMHSRPRRDGIQTVTLFSDSIMANFVEPQHAIERAAIVGAVADLLEMNGYRCEIVSVGVALDRFQGSAYQYAVTIKSAGDRMNLNDVVFSLGHPSFLRRLIFAVVATDPNLRYIWSYMGIPEKAFDQFRKPKKNEFYIPQIRSGIQKTLTGSPLDNAIRFWKISVDGDLPIEIDELKLHRREK